MDLLQGIRGAVIPVAPIWEPKLLSCCTNTVRMGEKAHLGSHIEERELIPEKGSDSRAREAIPGHGNQFQAPPWCH